MNKTNSNKYKCEEFIGKGFKYMEKVIGSAFGEVFKAFNTVSNDYVAVKKVKGNMNDAGQPSESNLLKECNSKYIVRYQDVVQHGEEIWVCTGEKL